MRTWFYLLLCLPVFACTTGAERQQSVEPELLLNQPLSRTSERAPPFARHIAQSRSGGIGGGIGGFLIGRAVNATVNADERARSRIGEVPTPQGVDPGLIIESMIADHLVSAYSTRPNLRSFFAGSVRETSSLERSPKVAELARRRGLGGVIIDVVALEYYADSSGRNLGLVNERFRIIVRAEMSLVDVASGVVLATGRCEGSHPNLTPIEAAIEDGARLTTLLAQKAAADCAVQLIARLVR